jgi:hypothetical protein
METNPKLVIVIGISGVQLIRMVCSNDREEKLSLKLYMKIKGLLNLIDESLKE